MHVAGGRIWRFLALLLAASLLTAACGDDDGGTATGGGARRTVAIAFVGALTGDAANLGINIRNGAKLAVDQANASGEMGDVRIVLKEFDTAGDPAQASTLKDNFIGDEQILGLVGPAFSGETKAVMPDLQAAGLVMVSASATNADLPNVVPDQTIFHRLIPDDDVQGKGIAEYVTQELDVDTVAYVHDSSEYGKGLADGTAKLLSEAGARTALTEAVDPKSQDFSAAVNKLRASRADLVFYGGYYAEAGRLKKQLSDAGVDMIFLTADGALDPGFIASAGAAGAEGAQITCPCNLATPESPGQLGDFAREYKAAFDVDPGTYSTEGYDAANILIEGIKGGASTRDALLEYVEEEVGTFDGVSKRIEFEENGNVKATGVFIFQVKGGKITLLGSTEELVG